MLEQSHQQHSVTSSTATITTPDHRLGLAVMMALMFMIGFLTCLNDILVPHLKQVFTLNYTQVMLVNFTFFTAYFVMAIPSGVIIERLGYKGGIITGLCTSGLAGIMFYPAAEYASYPLFLLALFVLASGFTLLQVAVNPFASLLGPKETASARLTLTQAFNSLGTFIAPRLGGALILGTAATAAIVTPELRAIAEAKSVQVPYLIFAAILFVLALVIGLISLPMVHIKNSDDQAGFRGAWNIGGLRYGVIGIFCYVGAEVAIGSLLINFMALPQIGAIPETEGAKFVAYYWGGAMVGRFVGSALLARTKPGMLLSVYAGLAGVLCLIGVATTSNIAMSALIAIGFCNSIMFPNIFTLAIRDTKHHTGHATSLLTMGIVGGAIVPLLQGALADRVGLQLSFVLPIFCYGYIVWYAVRGWKHHHVLVVALVGLLSWGVTPAVAQDPVNTFLTKVETFVPQKQGVQLTTKEAVCEITVYAPTIVRVRMAKKEMFQHNASLGSPFAVITEPQNTRYAIQEEGERIVVKTDSLHVVIHRDPLRISFQTVDGQIINEDDRSFGVSWIGSEVTAYKRIFSDERFLGLGEKAGSLDRRGNAFVNWNSDNPGYPTWGVGSDPLYVTIPFYIGAHSGKHLYGIFFDNSYKSKFNFGASNNRFMSFGAEHGEMNYYFMTRSTIAGILEDYTSLTGRMPLPAKWAIGFQQCRYSYYPDKELLTVARTMREKNFPCDVMYLDIHYMDNYKVFTWHPTRYAKPQETIRGLKELGMRLAIIVDPGIKIEKGYVAYEDGLKENIFAKYPDGAPYSGEVWPSWSHFPDFTMAKGRAWWGKHLAGYVRDGVSGFWNDMNEPATWGQQIPDLVQFDFEGNTATHKKAHNVFGMQMARASYEGAKQAMGERPFILTRAAYSGVQRYSAVWTGDNLATEEHLMYGVRLMSSMGLSGVPFIGTDVGGFIGNASKELFARWIAVGAFSPFFRVHKAYDQLDSEPWSYGETVEHIAREYIRLRYRLMPYLYSVFRASSLTGTPVLSPLAFHTPFAAQVYSGEAQEQFLVGQSIMVAPTAGMAQFRKVFFPHENSDITWYDMFTDKQYNAGEFGIVETPLEKTPVFVRSGSIICMQSQTQHAEERASDTLFVHVYPGKNNSKTLWYDDDGKTFAYQEGKYAQRTIEYNAQQQSITMTAQQGTYTSPFKFVKVFMHGNHDTAKAWQSERWSIIAPIQQDDPLGKSIGDTGVSVRTKTFPLVHGSFDIILR